MVLQLVTDCKLEVLQKIIKKWALNANFEEDSDFKIIEIVSGNGVPNIIQHILIRLRKNDAKLKTKLYLEVALKHNEEDDPLNPLEGIPEFKNLRPMTLLSELFENGNWFRNNVKIGNKPNEVKFDDVEEWYNSISNFAEKIPQVIIGWGGKGDLPASDPDIISKILAGIANVHVATSESTMDLINEFLGENKVPPGGIRILLGNSINSSSNPLYSIKRIDEIKRKFKELFS